MVQIPSPEPLPLEDEPVTLQPAMRPRRAVARKPKWPWIAAGGGVLAALVVVAIVAGIFLATGGGKPDETGAAPPPDHQTKQTAPLKTEPQDGPKEKPKSDPKVDPPLKPRPEPPFQHKFGTQASTPLLSNVAIRSAELEPLVIAFSIEVDAVKGAKPFEKKCGLWFCFGTPTTVPSLHVELGKALKESENQFFLNMRGPGFYAAQCSIRQDTDKPEAWLGTINLGKDVVKGDEVEIPSAFGPTRYKLTEVPISWVYFDSEKRLSNELKATVDLKAGKTVLKSEPVMPDVPKETWKPWASEIEPAKPGAPAAILTADYLPHKAGTSRREIQTFFDDDGKPSSITTMRLQQRDNGVLASKIISLQTGGSTIKSEDLFPESITRYALRDGFMCVGYPKDDKKPDAEITWYRLLKIGAKPRDRWSEAIGKDDAANSTEFKAAGMYRGKPCVVVGGDHSYTIFVEKVGKVLHRSYKKKDDMWILSTEEKFE